MSEITVKNLSEPDDRISAEGVEGQIVVLGETHIGRYVHQPGWCWSKQIKAAVGTPWCNIHHQGYMLSGRMKVISSNGAERIMGPGDVFDVPPGHDACVVGDEPSVSIEWLGVRSWGRPPVRGERQLTNLMMTDIVRSTDMARRLGDDAWRGLLDRHYQRIRAEVDRYRGYGLQTTGDGMLALFDGTARAALCAAAIVRAARLDGLQVRAGVHTGEVEVHADGILGLAVHLATRIMSAARADEVLLSNSAALLLEGSGLSLEDAGEHEFKGVEGPRKVFRLLSGESPASPP